MIFFSGCIFVAVQPKNKTGQQVMAQDQHVRMFSEVEMVFALWNIGRSQSFNI